MLDEPLKPADARALIRKILKSGGYRFSEHSAEEMAKDNLVELDCVNVLRAGQVEPPDFEKGSWRYRVFTPKIVVVVAFRSETQMSVVTAWRL